MNEDDCKIIVNRGGTRSSKTRSLLDIWFLMTFYFKKINILISRSAMPTIRKTILKDFEALQNELCINCARPIDGTQNERCTCKGKRGKKLNRNRAFYFRHHKTEHYFENKRTGSRIYFLPSISEQSAKGAEWDYIHLNEGDEIPWPIVQQYLMRLKGKLVVDFNPDDPDCWINREVEMKRKDFRLIKSSYKDNPFLPPSTVKEIEILKAKDSFYWNVYGEGEYSVAGGLIYPDAEEVSVEAFMNFQGVTEFGGMDFGWTAPSTFIWMKWDGEETIWLHEVFYEPKLKPQRMYDKAREEGVGNYLEVYGDPAASSDIEALFDLGLDIMPAKKPKQESIRFCKRFKFKYTSESVNWNHERKKYKHAMTAAGTYTEMPIEIPDDHALDAMRYGIYNHLWGSI